jgi:O-antigen biosynthesis protein
MNPRIFWSRVKRVAWRSHVAKIFASIRLYGWAATARKTIHRGKNFLNRRYRKPAWGREHKSLESVSIAAAVFGRPTVLIVGSLDLPQCKKYRVSQKVEYFRSIGWDCYISEYADVYRCINYLQISTALIFYRVPNCAHFKQYLEEARRLGIKTFYDIDDPIFNLEVYSENSNLEHIGSHEREHLLSDAVNYRDAMLQTDARILSTTYLKELAASELGGPTYLWRNLVDAATLSIVQSVGSVPVVRNPDKVVIGYASGSRAHDEDFRVVATALETILDSYEHVEFHVIGYALMPQELSRFKDRINVRPFTGYLKYLEALSQVDINVVPLVDDRFNACKSAIRYLEAALCRVPTIASAVGQFAEIITDGRDGKLAATHESWVSALRSCIDSPELRFGMGEAARSNVIEQHSFHSPGAIDPELLQQFELPNE